MTRDYARSGKTSNRKANKPKSQMNRRKPTSQGNGGGVFWFVSGAAVGSLLTALILVPMIGSDSEELDNRVVEPKQEANTRPKFDFYKLLSENEVIVADDEPEQAPTSNAPTVAEPASIYLLQAGSFKSAGDADSLRAQLLLMNLDANIEKAKSAGGETWYRVMVGPFDTRGSMSDARSRLGSNGVQTLVLKRKQ